MYIKKLLPVLFVLVTSSVYAQQNFQNVKPITRQEALVMEKKLALDLRRHGYAVWFN